MSKASRRKKRKRPKPPKGPRARLLVLAAALNECERRGERIRFAGDAVFTSGGAILRPMKKGQQWEVRMFAGNGAALPPQPDDLDE